MKIVRKGLEQQLAKVRKLYDSRPIVDHYIDEKNYDRKFAEKHLMKHPLKDALFGEVAAAYRGHTDVQRFGERWLQMADLKANVEFSDIIDEAEKKLVATQRVVNIISAVRIDVEMVGGDRNRQAHGFLEAGAGAIPASLIEVLQKHAAKHDAAAASATRTAMPVATEATKPKRRRLCTKGR